MNKKKKKATIFDVADKANVAISTVSRVINDSPLVKDDTKDRVKEAIKALNFQPNRTAKSLAQKSNVPVITIAVPSFTTRFYTALLKGVKAAMHDFEADLLIFDRGFDQSDEHLLSFLDRGAVDGLLLAGSMVTPAVEYKLGLMNVPVVG
jgi:LacI family transcriptional regulator